MSYNVAVHVTIYLIAGLHVIAGAAVGGVYLRVLIKAPKGRRIRLHARHVVPAAFGWAGAVFAEGYHTLIGANLALPVVWTDYLLLASLLSLGYALAVLVGEKTFGKAAE